MFWEAIGPQKNIHTKKIFAGNNLGRQEEQEEYSQFGSRFLIDIHILLHNDIFKNIYNLCECIPTATTTNASS